MWLVRITRRTMGEFLSFLISDMNNHLTDTATLPANGFAVPGNSEPKFQQPFPSSLKNEQKFLKKSPFTSQPHISPEQPTVNKNICVSSLEEGKWGKPSFQLEKKRKTLLSCIDSSPPFPPFLHLPNYLFLIFVFYPFFYFSFFVHSFSLTQVLECI